MNGKQLWDLMMYWKNPARNPVKYLTAVVEVTKLITLDVLDNGEPVEGVTITRHTANYVPGDQFKVVMASRFGDVGLTEELDKDYGYDYRVPIFPDAEHRHNHLKFDECFKILQVVGDWSAEHPKRPGTYLLRAAPDAEPVEVVVIEGVDDLFCLPTAENWRMKETKAGAEWLLVAELE